MRQFPRRSFCLPAFLLSLLLAACGGGGGENDGNGGGKSASSNQPLTAIADEPGAPAATGNTATDGLNRFNFRRQQMGLPMLTRDAKLDAAALGHSEYQRLNNEITHMQTEGRPGFTGVCLLDHPTNPNDATCPAAKVSRLEAANYVFDQGAYAAGEVIARSVGTSGANAAEELIAAIYHRFVIFEPMFKGFGGGAATATGGSPTYFTANFAANGLSTGLGPAQVAVYPVANQERVPRVFYSDNEMPDPVSDANEVGYPVSVHADIRYTVTVQSFTIRPRGGAELPVYRLESTTDPHMKATAFASAAAIIPKRVLDAGTTYDVNFVGTVNGQSVSRSWSFTTQ